MTKIFECPIWSHTPLFLWENRPASRASFTLGANVLNGLIPIPAFDEINESEWDSRDRSKARGLLWFMKNVNVPKAHFSQGLGVTVTCEVLSQLDSNL